MKHLQTMLRNLAMMTAIACGLMAPLSLQGCAQSTTIWGCLEDASDERIRCPPPEDAGSDSSDDAETCDGDAGLCDAGEEDGGPPCPGQCEKNIGFKWTGPQLVYIGPKEGAPVCPEQAPNTGYEGYADLETLGSCNACICSPSMGSCTLPSTIKAYDEAVCPTPSGASPTSFDPPVEWDGSCTTANAILEQDKSCPNGPCVSSLAIGKLNMTGSGCQAETTPGPGLGTPHWKTYALGCSGIWHDELCKEVGNLCVASVAQFKHCVYGVGEISICPEGYPERHVFYEGFTDLQHCTPCGCGPQEGSSCKAKISIYADDACGDEIASYVVTSSGPLCADIQPVGTTLGSKSATPAEFVPGACQPNGGQIAGSVTLMDSSTICCAEE